MCMKPPHVADWVFSVSQHLDKSQRGKTASYFSFLLSYVSSSSVSLLFLFPFHCLSQSSGELKQERSRYLKFEERHYYDFSLKGQVEPQA